VEVRTVRRLSRARQLVDLGRWGDAVTELEMVLAAEPASVEALCMLGQSRLNLGEPDAGCRAAEAALAMAPDHEWAHRVHSVALGMTGRHDRAVAAAREAVRLAPDHPDGHQRLAHALLHLPGRAAEAGAAAERAVELAPHDPDAHVAVGLAAGRQGQRRPERDAYLRALALDPGHATALNNLAAIDTERGRLGGASRLLTSALGSDPHHKMALANLDVVAVHVLRRMTAVVVLGGLLVAVLAVAGADPAGAVPHWLRSAAGVAVIGTSGLVAWSSLRHMPAGARRHLRGLPRRASGWDRALGAAFLAMTVALIVAAFLPGDAAEWGSAGVLAVFRVGWLALVVALGRVIWAQRGQRR
jgi:tetratricopeptide (TPR) repeat protein